MSVAVHGTCLTRVPGDARTSMAADGLVAHSHGRCMQVDVTARSHEEKRMIEKSQFWFFHFCFFLRILLSCCLLPLSVQSGLVAATLHHFQVIPIL